MSFRITGLSYESLLGPSDVMYRNAPKLVRIDVPVPKGYTGDITVELINDQYDDDVFVDFCGLDIVDTGGNIPCVDMVNDIVVTNGDESKTVDE